MAVYISRLWSHQCLTRIIYFGFMLFGSSTFSIEAILIYCISCMGKLEITKFKHLTVSGTDTSLYNEIVPSL